MSADYYDPISHTVRQIMQVRDRRAEPDAGQLDRIELMLAYLLLRQTPPEALESLWQRFPWLRPPEPAEGAV